MASRTEAFNGRALAEKHPAGGVERREALARLPRHLRDVLERLDGRRPLHAHDSASIASVRAGLMKALASHGPKDDPVAFPPIPLESFVVPRAAARALVAQGRVAESLKREVLQALIEQDCHA